MLLHDLILRQARTAPASIAVHHGGRQITYAELWERVRSSADLVDRLTAPGDRVAVLGANHPVWLDCLYGVPAAGRIATFLNHRLSVPELVAMLERAGASLLIASSPELARLPRDLPGLTLTFDEWEDACQAPAGPSVPAAADAAAPAWLIFTSGTTAVPKGALLTHAGLLSAVAVTAASRPVAGDDVYLFPFPLCHVAAYNVVHNHARGRPVVLLDRFEADGFIAAAERHRATSTSLAATMLSGLLDAIDGDGAARRAVGSLRSVAYGAAPMPLATLQRADALLGVEFAQGYGMTELSGNAAFLGPDEHRRGLDGETWLLSSAGRPGPGVELRIVDDEGDDVPPGTPGEIAVRAAQVMAGYWQDPVQTEAAIRDGWLFTGDVGRLDHEGRLYIVDRKKDVIVTGGENVSSIEVEEALYSHPAVREAAVVGLADTKWGENVCAVIVARPESSVDPADVIDHVRARLAGFKAPRHIVVVDALPRNGSGKVLKADLRAWLAADPGAAGPRR